MGKENNNWTVDTLLDVFQELSKRGRGKEPVEGCVIKTNKKLILECIDGNNQGRIYLDFKEI